MIANDPCVVFEVIEEIDHQCAVGAQADIGALINVTDVDQDRISILPAPASNLRDAARKAPEVRVSRVIARRQNVSVQIGRVENRDLNRVAVRPGDGARDGRCSAKQTRLPDRFKKRAPSGGTHLHRHISISVRTQFHFY